VLVEGTRTFAVGSTVRCGVNACFWRYDLADFTRAMSMSEPVLSASPIDYAPQISARRRLLRRWSVSLVSLGIIVIGIVYGPRLYRHWQLLRVQEACMTMELPKDRPVFEMDRASASVLVAAWPAEYQYDESLGWALRFDPRWTAMESRLPAPTLNNLRLGAMATTFCHERHTPDGRRRLVVLEGSEYYTVIEPAGWFGGAPRVVARRKSARLMDLPDGAFPARKWNYHEDAGIADPADRSRFTASFVYNGAAGTWEYRLGDDEQLTMRLLDPEGFVARVRAAHAARMTRSPAL